MYRSASRYDSRSIPEKPSRSGRSSWVNPQSRPYGGSLEEDRGSSRDPYIPVEPHILEKGFQQHKGGSSSNDLREAQRLAASFFSQYPAASPPEPGSHTYRDQPTRSSRLLSPEVPMERYSSRGQYRDRDSGVERWSDRSTAEGLYSYRSQLVPEGWESERVSIERRERMDVYGERGRKRDDGGWDVVDYEFGVARKESEYPPIQRGDPDSSLRITKRVDWTGLIRSDLSRIEGSVGIDSTSFGKRTPQISRGGRAYVDSFHHVPDDNPDPEDSLYARRGGGYFGDRYREPDVQKDRGILVDRPQEREIEFGRISGPRGAGREVRDRDEWKVEREVSAGRGLRLTDMERGRDKVHYEERDSSRRPLYNGVRHATLASGGQREKDAGDEHPIFPRGRGGGKYGPKRDFSQRASITNQDILAVYYGNPGDGSSLSSKFVARRNFVPPRYYAEIGSKPEKWRPRRTSGSPVQGRPRRPVNEFDSSRKGKKRWEKPTEGTTEVKRFKRETQSDKLYLMHNSKATSGEKEKEVVALPTASAVGAEDGKAEVKEDEWGNTSEPFEVSKDNEATPEEQKAGHLDSSNGWGINDSWTESEEERDPVAQSPLNPEANSDTWGTPPKHEERDKTNFGTPPSVPIAESKKILGECSQDDEDAGWECLASDLDDHLDDVCMHQGLEAAGIMEDPDKKGVPFIFSEPAQEEYGTIGAMSDVQVQNSEMVDVDNTESSEDGNEVPMVGAVVKDDPTIEEDRTAIDGRERGEKKKVVIMEELQESVKIREDKAFDYYVSLFDQDMDLMKLYEANSISGSFECLVCAGVGAKKKKRFPDVGGLVQHAKKILRTKKLPEHRGFARAVCKILGWENVAGPSVILPRSCNPLQDTETTPLPGSAPVIQTGDGTKGAAMDWEWASARQLFEAQEARINVTARVSDEMPQAENSGVESITTCSSLGNDGLNVNTGVGARATDMFTAADPISSPDHNTGRERQVTENNGGALLGVLNGTEGVGDSVVPNVVQPYSNLGTLFDANSTILFENGGICAVMSELEKGTEVERSFLLEKTTAVESITVSKHSTGMETISFTNSIQPSGRLLIPEVEELPCASNLVSQDPAGMTIEMWAPLPQDGIETEPVVSETADELPEVAATDICNVIPSLEVGDVIVVYAAEKLVEIRKSWNSLVPSVRSETGETQTCDKSPIESNLLEVSAAGIERTEIEQSGDSAVPSVTGSEPGVSHTCIASIELGNVYEVPPAETKTVGMALCGDCIVPSVTAGETGVSHSLHGLETAFQEFASDTALFEAGPLPSTEICTAETKRVEVEQRGDFIVPSVTAGESGVSLPFHGLDTVLQKVVSETALSEAGPLPAICLTGNLETGRMDATVLEDPQLSEKKPIQEMVNAS